SSELEELYLRCENNAPGAFGTRELSGEIETLALGPRTGFGLDKSVQVVSAHAAQDSRIAPFNLFRMLFCQPPYHPIAFSLQVLLLGFGFQFRFIERCLRNSAAVRKDRLQLQNMIDGFHINDEASAAGLVG